MQCFAVMNHSLGTRRIALKEIGWLAVSKVRHACIFGLVAHGIGVARLNTYGERRLGGLAVPLNNGSWVTDIPRCWQGIIRRPRKIELQDCVLLHDARLEKALLICLLVCFGQVIGGKEE